MSGRMNGATLPARRDAVGARCCTLLDAIEQKWCLARTDAGKKAGSIADFTGPNRLNVAAIAGVTMPPPPKPKSPQNVCARALTARGQDQKRRALARTAAIVRAIKELPPHRRNNKNIEMRAHTSDATIVALWPQIAAQLTPDEVASCNLPHLPHYQRQWGANRRQPGTAAVFEKRVKTTRA